MIYDKARLQELANGKRTQLVLMWFVLCILVVTCQSAVVNDLAAKKETFSFDWDRFPTVRKCETSRECSEIEECSKLYRICIVKSFTERFPNGF